MSDTYTEFGPLNFDANQVAHQGYGMASSGPTPDRMIVAFYPDKKLNVAKSKEQGKPVWETIDKVMIQNPGETLTIQRKPATDEEKRKWPRQWAAYVQGKEQIPDGMPVSLLFPAHPSIVETLRGYGVHTVEQLANLSGNAIQTIGMGAQDWVNKAAKYLDQAEKGVNFHQFNKVNEEKDRKIATLERQVSDMNARMQQLMTSLQAQPRIAQQMTPQQNYDPTFDVQSSMIANLKVQEEFAPPPVNLAQTIGGEVRKRKPRSDRGQPRGPRKET